MNYLTSLFLDASDPGLLLYGTYNTGLVVLSVCVAIFASAMALQIAGMARLSTQPLYRQVALLTGSLALGGGVWSMHFIGMLAFELCAQVTYQPSLTLLSLLPSLGASWVALNLLVRRQISRVQLVIGGVLVGAGIGAMHYSGMAAMKMAPLLRYDPWWFAVSIIVAVVLAIIALWVRFGLRGRLSAGKAILASAVVMGVAIAGMHYTGMLAARFIGVQEAASVQGNANSVFLAAVVSLITVMLTLLVVGANGLLRYRQLYRQMQSNESRLRAILFTAVDGIITLDGRGAILGMNPAAESIFGWSLAEAEGRDITGLIPSAVAGTQADARETEGVRRDGSRLPIRLAIGKADIPGQALYVAFVNDISARKAMERALRDSEQQYRSLIRNIPGVSFRILLGEQWSTQFISEAVEKLTGWAPEEFISGRRHYLDMVHADDRQRLDATVREAIAGSQSYVIEYRLQGRDGSEHWVSESGSAVDNQAEGPQWIDGVIVDITESRLRNAEFEGTVTAISRALAVADFNMDGTVRTANQNYLDLMGYRHEEIAGQHHRLFCEPAHAGDPAYAEFWARLGRGEFQTGEFKRLGKDGKQVWLQATYNPILNVDGKPFKVVELATDTSQRHEMEQALREAKGRAEQAVEVKSTFLANMSHEIRTPMNAIIGFTELLMGTTLDTMQRRHLGTVRHAARSLLGLLNDILDTAKLERGALELECVDFSLRELCEQICAAMRLEAQNKGLTLSLDYHAGVGDFFKGDPLRIQQVLTNLVGNAVKFTERGWVRLEVSAQAGRVRLAVHDSGIGIAADRVERIFDPFAQADASMSRRFGGTGLGTTIARQLVWLMDGEISVQSRLGEGSVFNVELPLAAGKAPVEIAQQMQASLAPLRILAADDVPQNIELLALTLGQLGHEVVTACDGDEAVARFIEGRYDVVLMDVQMPHTDGLEATRRIRRHEAEHGLAPTPVVALTASVLEEDRRAASAAGMDGFASKPLELHKLLEEIARVIGEAPPVTLPVAQPAAVTPTRVIDWEHGQHLWGNRAALSGAIQRFLNDNAAMDERFSELLARGQLSTAVEQAHRLRGAAANLTLSPLAQLAGQLEQALKAGEQQAAQALLEPLGQALLAVVEELGAVTLADVPRAAQSSVATVELVQPLLADVQVALRRGELAEDELQVLSDSLPELGQGALCQALEGALQDFDFERAEDILNQLLEWSRQAAQEGAE